MKKYVKRLGVFDDTDDSAGDPAVEDVPSESNDESDIYDELFAGERVTKAEVAMRTGLSPAEFVRELVHRRDGSIRQRELVRMLDWSDSSVSRLLCRMEANGAIERLEIGREKLVFLPGRTPESARSPFSDDD